MQALYTSNINAWKPNIGEASSQALVLALEQGQVLFLPKLGFKLEEAEKQFLSPAWLDGSRKNISLEGAKVGGAQGAQQDLARLAAMVARFSQEATVLIHTLFPQYAAHLHQARTSYRPSPVGASAAISWKKDDSRLHVDAFPSRPNHGERILRVFANVNPNNEARVWRVGEPFEAASRRFLPKINKPSFGLAWLLNTLKITKKKRSEYDHIMLHLHDGMKADMDFQQNVSQETVYFPPSSVWICFSDQVLHAAMSGQFMFEQTFHLPIAALQHPELSPLKVLERLKDRALI